MVDPAIRPLRVCHITTMHARNDPRIFLKECVSLAAAGHEVHYVLGDGLGDRTVSGVRIHDVGAKPASRLRRMWLHTRRIKDAVLSIKPDVVHFHDPECLPLGVGLAARGMRVIYDVHEDVPSQMLGKQWIPYGLRGALSRGFAWYQRRSVRRLAGVVAATPHIQKRFAELGERAICVNNFAFADEMAPLDRPSARRRSVCYVGGIGRARGIVSVIKALPLVPGVRLTLCGPFYDARLEAELRAEPGWAQVDYRGSVDRDTVRRVLAESCAGIVNYLADPNHVDAQPTKLFEYMSAALPVIASDFPLWKTFIADTGAGVCVDPESPQALASAIRALVDNPALVDRMGQAGRRAVLNQFNWSVEARKLTAFYERLS